MSEGRLELDRYIAEELKRNNGVLFPVKSGILFRMLKKKAGCRDLHPNPDDEFCDPDIGPSYRIISEYQHKFANDIANSAFFSSDRTIAEYAKDIWNI